jgi:transcriptional regulator with XRE-family HTH domain
MLQKKKYNAIIHAAGRMRLQVAQDGSKWSETGPAATCTSRLLLPATRLRLHRAVEANNRMRMAKTDIANPIDRHVGSRLRMRRLASGMSQQSLAEEIGVTFQQVQKYEKGMNRIGASRLQQAANVLEISVPFFFEGGATGGTYIPDGSAPSPTYIDNFASTSDGLKLAKAFTRTIRVAPPDSDSRAGDRR